MILALKSGRMPRPFTPRVPAAASLPGRTVSDHPLGDELGRQSRVLDVHRLDPLPTIDRVDFLKYVDFLCARARRARASARSSSSQPIHGFEFGYGGAGPTELAICILLDFFAV